MYGYIEEIQNVILYQPKSKPDLMELINTTSISLSSIDISLLTDLSAVCKNTIRKDFSGIEKWNVSHVTNMSYMFENTSFNENISNWNVSNVKNMSYMFKNSNFNQPINNWNVSNLVSISEMFMNSPFNHNLNNWDSNKFQFLENIFKNTPLEETKNYPNWYKKLLLKKDENYGIIWV